MTEEWRGVPGWEDLYEVSDMGRIRSLDRVVAGKNNTTRRITGRVLKCATRFGYKMAYLCRPYAEKKRYAVHRLVLSTFSGHTPEGMDCCHNDGVRDNNKLSNLRWDTRAGNFADMEAHGTKMYGEKANSSKLKSSDVREIRRRLEAGEYQKVIAQDYGVNQSTVQGISVGRIWSHLK